MTSLREALGSWWIVRGCFLLSIGSWLIISIGIRAKALLQVARSGESCNLWQGAQVILSTALSSIEGRVLGVDSRGALRLEVDGVEQGFSGGSLV